MTYFFLPDVTFLLGNFSFRGLITISSSGTSSSVTSSALGSSFFGTLTLVYGQYSHIKIKKLPYLFDAAVETFGFKACLPGVGAGEAMLTDLLGDLAWLGFEPIGAVTGVLYPSS